MSYDATPEDEAWTTESGLVTLFAPTGTRPYYRLEWYLTDGGAKRRKQTTVGRSYEKAWEKAVAKDRELTSGATVKTELPCSVGIAYWLSPTRPKAKSRGWGTSQQTMMQRFADDYFTPAIGTLRHLDLTWEHLEDIVNRAPNDDQARRVRQASLSLIHALKQGRYVAGFQDLDLSAVSWRGAQAAPVAVSEDEARGFVSKSARPSDDQVCALRGAAEAVGRGIWWRGLMVELAAYSGLRFAELTALDTSAVDVLQRTIDVRRQVDYKSKGPKGFRPPKGGKARRTGYPAVSPTGYDLAAAVKRRLREVAKERRAGTNPLGLLFPSRTGQVLQTGSFHRDVFEPAALKAGWSWEWKQRPMGRKKGHQLQKYRSFGHSWHSLRHTFCTVALEHWGLAATDVASLAGHASVTTTLNLYVGSSDSVLDSFRAATGSAPPPNGGTDLGN